MSDPFEALLVRFAPPRAGEAITVPAPADLRFDFEWPGGCKTLSCTLTFPAGTAVPAGLDRMALTTRPTTSSVRCSVGQISWSPT